jgi:hypothetical protein
VFRGKPLKKDGFHIKKGAIPHFNKIENIIINHTIPIEKRSLELETDT